MKVDLSRLSTQQHAPVRELVALLQAMAGEQLRSLAVVSEPDEPLVRSVIVLEEVDLYFVRQLGAQGAALGRAGVQAPLLMSPEYIRASLDTFPIELLEIQQRHVQVLGEDYFAALEFRKADVRLELERELKREKLQIRQGVLSAGDRASALAEIYAGARDQTLRLLRAVLWLHDQPEPASESELLAVAAGMTGLELSALEPGKRPGRLSAFEPVRELYDTVLGLANFVDRLAV